MRLILYPLGPDHECLWGRRHPYYSIIKKTIFPSKKHLSTHFDIYFHVNLFYRKLEFSFLEFEGFFQRVEFVSLIKRKSAQNCMATPPERLTTILPTISSRCRRITQISSRTQVLQHRLLRPTCTHSRHRRCRHRSGRLHKLPHPT